MNKSKSKTKKEHIKQVMKTKKNREYTVNDEIERKNAENPMEN